MEFFKMNKLKKALKPDKEPDKEKDKEKEKEHENDADEEEDDDDDFIMNEVKRRLKELRRNSLMVLIPEEEETETETYPPDEEEEMELETSSGTKDEWRDVEEEGRRLWSCFGAFYDMYCERMLFFDRQLLHHIQQCCSDNNNSDANVDVESGYVSHLCLAWEALHCQYTQLLATASDTSAASKCYNHSAQQFQQFEVLLHRFLENEPFQPAPRPLLYAHSRATFPKLLQVPNLSGEDMTEEEEESDMLVRAPDLLRIIQTSILTFQMFIKMDKQKKKQKKNKSRNLFGGQGQNQVPTPLQQLQSSLDKRKVRLKELWKKRKGGKNEWPATQEEVELLLGLIDVKVVGRVLRMLNITKDHLVWSEEKLKKLHVSTTKLQRDPSPILFHC